MNKQKIREHLIHLLRRWLNTLEQSSGIQSYASEKGVMSPLCAELIQNERMLCRSAAIATIRQANNPQRLVEILQHQHLGIERTLAKMGIKCYRSEIGSEFNPETQQADDLTISTNDPALEGCVACSVEPALWFCGQLIENECVALYVINE